MARFVFKVPQVLNNDVSKQLLGKQELGAFDHPIEVDVPLHVGAAQHPWIAEQVGGTYGVKGRNLEGGRDVGT